MKPDIIIKKFFILPLIVFMQFVLYGCDNFFHDTIDEIKNGAIKYQFFIWSVYTGGPPSVDLVYPYPGSSNVSLNSKILVRFSKAMDPDTITASEFTVIPPVSGLSVRYANNAATLSLPSGTFWAGNTIYKALIKSNVKDEYGNGLKKEYSWTFTTGTEIDSTPPNVSLVSPVDFDTDVPVNTRILTTFNEPIDPTSINESSFIIREGGLPVSGTISFSNNSAIITPLSYLSDNGFYTVDITTDVQDLAGNNLDAAFQSHFFTGRNVDATPPTVISTDPVHGQTSVSGETMIRATFSESLDPSTINTSSFTLSQGDIPINGMVTYIGDNATFEPLDDLWPTMPFTARITSSVSDLCGNTLDACDWTFTTGIVPENMAQELTFFDHDMDEDQIQGPIYISRAADESDVTHYVLFWGINSTTKLGDRIVDIAKTGSDLTYEFPQDTAVPAGATHLLVYTKNECGKMTTPISLLKTDGISYMVFDKIFDMSYRPCFTVFNDKMYYPANNISEYSLWEYDDSLPIKGYEPDKNPKILDLFGPVPERISTGSTYKTNSISYNDKLYFSGDGSYMIFHTDPPSIETVYTGNELWVYDGSAEPNTMLGTGITVLADIYPGGDYDSSPNSLTIYNQKLFFTANDGTNGRELWVYDDSLPIELGTNPEMVYNIYTGASSSSPDDLIVYNDKLYFSAADGTNGRELWVYDDDLPVSAGSNPKMLYSIASGSTSSNPMYLCVYNNKLFFAANDNVNGMELWVYDDSLPVAAGTNPAMVYNINPVAYTTFPIAGNSFPYCLTVFQDKLYFSANDGTSDTELWVYDDSLPVKSDEPDKNPRSVYQVSPNSNLLFSGKFAVFNDKLFFSGDDGTTDGVELWVHNGSNITSMVHAIYPGNDSIPGSFMIYNNKLFYTATTELYGRVLWIYYEK